MHIALDLDGVLLDFVGGICDALRAEYDSDIEPADIDTWDLHQHLDPIIGKSWWSWMRERNLWPSFPAIDGAIGAVDQLNRDGHYLEIVTAKPEWATSEVWKWLGKNQPKVHQVTIVDVTGESKHVASSADLLVDDKIENCTNWCASSVDRNAIVFGQPYNAKHWQALGVYRTEGWPATLRLIREQFV